MCAVLVCRWGRRQGCFTTLRSHSQRTHSLCEASHLFSWFCFSPPRGLWTLLENKGNFKNSALPVFPNVQNAAVSLNSASSDAQPCRCRRKPPALRLPPPTSTRCLGGGWTGEGSVQLTGTPAPEPASDPTWELRAHVGGRRASFGGFFQKEGSLGVVGGEERDNTFTWKLLPTNKVWTFLSILPGQFWAEINILIISTHIY